MTAPALVKRYAKGTDSDATDCLIAGLLGGGNDGIGRRTQDDPNLVSATLKAQRGKGGGGIGPEEQLIALAVTENMRGELRETDYANALAGSGGKPGQGYPAARTSEGVRRLTPVECERLQGFPDHWTAYGPDSRRYAALGDAVTVNVAEWIGRRLAGSGRGGPT